MSNPAGILPPGFRFHPTDEELIHHYLRNRAASAPCPVSIIADVDIYKFDPWDLPSKAMFGEKEWYFFTPRDRKYPNGVRPNRSAASGYWKATGTDKQVHATTTVGNESIGVKKALVFYQGKPPKGVKTNWIMHEYRLAESPSGATVYKPMRLKESSMRLDDWVLCRIYKKSNHLSSEFPAMDREHEDSGAEEAYLPASPAPKNNFLQQRNFDIHKSTSLSELLGLLFDNPSEIIGADSGSQAAQASSSQALLGSTGDTNDYQFQQFLQNPEFAAPETGEASLKRLRPAAAAYFSDDGSAAMNPSKKINQSCSIPSFGNQFGTAQYNLLSHP